jgi:hypothetical protein
VGVQILEIVNGKLRLVNAVTLGKRLARSVASRM